LKLAKFYTLNNFVVFLGFGLNFNPKQMRAGGKAKGAKRPEQRFRMIDEYKKKEEVRAHTQVDVIVILISVAKVYGS